MTYWLRFRRALSLLTLVLFGFFVGFCILELFLRIYNPFFTTVKGNDIVLRAGLEYRFPGKPEFGTDTVIYYRTNSLGFRGPDPPTDGLAGRLSIVAVGGSTTNCLVLNEEKTWPGVLYLMIKEAHPNAWLNNAGMVGHTTFAHAQLLRDYVLDLNPDYVLFMVGVNDIEKEEISQYDREIIRRGIDLDSFRGFFKSMATTSETVALGINLYRHVRAIRKGLPYRGVNPENCVLVELEPAHEVDRTLQEQAVRYLPGYCRRVESLVEMTRARGATPVLITQPALYGDAVDDVTGVDLAKVTVRGASGRSGSLQWRVLEAYNDVTRRVAEEDDILLIDLARELPKSSALFYDMIHFNNNGAAEVARIVWCHLEPVIDAQSPSTVSGER